MLTLLFSVATGAFGQVCLKKGMMGMGESSLLQMSAKPLALLANAWLWAGGFLYLLSFALWLVVLSGTELSKAYPMVSLGYLVTSVLGVLLFGEQVTFTRFAGLFIILSGVLVMSRS